MSKLSIAVIVLIVPLVCYAQMAAAADPIASPDGKLLPIVSNESLSLTSLPNPRPVVVRAYFEFHDINGINDEAETFDFSGVLTLKWHDPRQAFDPVVEGANERVFSGGFQFNELSPGWYPQVILLNESGLFQKSGVILRIQSDGTSVLTETLNATAKGEYDMRQFPFDKQRLEASFEVLGFDRDEVLLQVEPDTAGFLPSKVRIPQWIISEAKASVQDHTAIYAGSKGISSVFSTSVDAQRNSFFTVRMIIFPLIFIVLLSFSVFWMDRSSIGDRQSVSFIGILTVVSYQIFMSDLMPHISYGTWIHAFLNISFLTMCSTILVNMAVSTLDKKGEIKRGDDIDRRCRWAFPLAYFGLTMVDILVFF